MIGNLISGELSALHVLGQPAHILCQTPETAALLGDVDELLDIFLLLGGRQFTLEFVNASAALKPGLYHGD